MEEKNLRNTSEQKPESKDIRRLRAEKERLVIQNEQIQVKAGMPLVQFHNV